MGIDIYLDSASFSDMEMAGKNPLIKGVTTNPSIMKKYGITKYREFAKTALALVNEKPISFEVLADDWETMERQAREIQSWGENVWVKIPITNTQGDSSRPLIEKLEDINLNVTAVMTPRQMYEVIPVLQPHHILSVFVGRITDTMGNVPRAGSGACNWLWASTREVYSIKRAELAGYHIITMTPELFAKVPLAGKDLTDYSLETVKQFHEDGRGIEL